MAGAACQLLAECTVHLNSIGLLKRSRLVAAEGC